MSTAIQWTDVTDNIIVVDGGGWWCRKISPGCLHCYAEKLNDSTYFKGNHLKYSGQPPKLKLRTEILDKWPRIRTPKKHFVASMTDIFGEWVPMEWSFKVFDAQRAAHTQIFQNLTKRPGIMREHATAWLKARGLTEMPQNIWLGTSCEDQQRADERIPELLKIPAKVRFLSCEPLLGEIDLEMALTEFQPLNPDLSRKPAPIHWVIIGGESGKGARPCDVQQIRSLVRQCKAAGVAGFVKQMGSHAVDGDELGDSGKPILLSFEDPKGGEIAEWPIDLRVREFPI